MEVGNLNMDVTENYESGTSYTTSSAPDDLLDIYDYPSLELPEPSQITLIVVYSVTALLSLTGNGLVIVVLLFIRRCKHALTIFLLNLAIADLLMAMFCIPFSFTKAMLGQWMFGDFLCTFVSFVQVTSVTVSITTNVVIGVDRFLAVRYPLKKYQSRTSASVAIAIIWILAVALAAAQIKVSHSSSFTHDGESYRDCSEKFPTPAASSAYTLVVFCVTYAAPLCIMVYTYSRVACILWAHSMPGVADVRRDRQNLHNKRKVVKMLITIVAMFAFCWLPLNVFNLVLEFSPEFTIITTRQGELSFLTIFYMCHWTAMAHSFVNPIIYTFLNDSFKVDMKSLWSRISSSFHSTKRMRSSSRSGSRASSTKKSLKMVSLRYNKRTKETTVFELNNLKI